MMMMTTDKSITKLEQIDLHKKLARLTCFNVQVFCCTSFLHQIEHSSIPRKIGQELV